ncbi:MAG TPA: sugar phosphate nucleotidyltransferase [Acidobacteriota bacterium]|nr:sugar phosphate nucleotidyltransferase [Acidobacteriota bacterium]
MFLFQRETHRRTALWGLVLAAGDGKRLQNYIQQVKGVDLPKQYVNFIGRRSMLEHTFERAEKLIPAQQILTIIGRHHLRFPAVRQQIGPRGKENIIVQPENKETGPGIILPLIYLYKRCPEAIVSVFPSDHFILEEDRFMDHVDLAVRAVVHDPSRIVLLAMEARQPEVEYGYIVPQAHNGELSLWGTRRAAKFVEKPSPAVARQLVNAGGLWNTMIMVFKVRMLLEMIQRLFPPTYLQFARIFDAIGTAEEARALESVYQTVKPMNFSKEFLEMLAITNPEKISVLPVLQVFWSDWGSPERLLDVLEMFQENKLRRNTEAAQCELEPQEPLIWQRQSASN